MAAQKQDDQHERTFSSYVRIRDVVLKTYLPRAMNDWEEWRERVRDIRATSAIWWWWWYIYNMCVRVFWQPFFINTYLIEHNTFFANVFFNPFELPYRSYDIRWEFIDKPSMISHLPSWTEGTWEITNCEKFINQLPPNTIRSIRQLERINKKYVDKKCL